MTSIKSAYAECKKRLRKAQIENHSFEALALFEKATGLDRLGIISNGDSHLSQSKLTALDELITRRINGEPLQYILGEWSFYGFDLYVGKGVLIPRDDTEVVTNLCLEFLKNKPSAKTADLCAGSGAISIALSKLAGASVTAVELSSEAFYYLEKNIKSHSACVKAIQGDIFKCYKSFSDSEFDLIVSNPPYIKSEEIPLLQTEVRQEPKMALDGGADGFDFYRAIIDLWSSKLASGGALAFELGEEQSDLVCSLMKQAGFENIRTETDFSGVQRAIIGTMLQK